MIPIERHWAQIRPVVLVLLAEVGRNPFRLLLCSVLVGWFCCGSLVPQSCETTVSPSTAGTTSTLRVEEHACRSRRCGEQGRTESWITKVLSSLQHPVEALGGFAQGGGSFQPYPPPETAGVDPSNLLVLNLTVEIHYAVKLGLSKPCWPSDHPRGSDSGLGNPSPSTQLCSGPRSMDRSL